MCFLCVCTCVCVCVRALVLECFQESEHLKESLKCCLLHLFGAIVAGDQVSLWMLWRSQVISP